MSNRETAEERGSNISRRDALSLLAGAAVGGPGTAGRESGLTPDATGSARRFRVRTLTAGVSLASLTDSGPVVTALEFLAAARRQVVAAGYEVQTVRVALNPLLLGVPATQRSDALPALVALDRLVEERGAVLNIGPVFAHGAPDESIAPWAAAFARATRATSFSVAVASAAHGVHAAAVQVAASVISALATLTPDGGTNFRFAAAANIPPGTPFFPVGYHEGPPSLAVGLESANLVADAFTGARDAGEATARLRTLLNAELRPVERLARAIAADGGRRYLGIDSSPAPATDCSIGAALEALTGQPFGAAATLQACAAVTAAIKSLDVETCGYSGLMLPVLEDPVLARRAVEGRVSLAQLLLYSSVCGTGLDLVPVPGEAAVAELGRIVGDMATLAVRLTKPLSARLLPVPGKRAGDPVAFADPRLCPSRVLAL